MVVIQVSCKTRAKGIVDTLTVFAGLNWSRPPHEGSIS